MENDPGKKKKASSKKSQKKRKALLMGVGLDCQDEHVRITTGENFQLLGGSKETHEVMQETAIKINEELHRRHKRLDDLGPSEFIEIVHKSRP